MKLLTIIFITMFAFMTAGLAFASERKDQLASEYLELSKTKETFETTIETYVDQLSSKNPGADKERMREFFEAYMGWDVLKEPMIKIVADSFTEEELIGINTFFKSRFGKVLAEKSPALSAAISELIGSNLNKAMGAMQQ